MAVCFNYKVSITNFYKNGKLNFNNINEEIINELKEKALQLSKFYNKTNILKLERYIKIMERIHTSNNLLPNNSQTEKFLLFMFTIDPNFEAFLIHSTCNTTKEIKTEMIDTFGVYDPYIVKIERHFINQFFNKEEKDKINEEIERRVFK